jgi:hypothetical protein
MSFLIMPLDTKIPWLVARQAPCQIDLLRNWFKVLWVHTGSVSAKVIKHQISRYFSNHVFIDNPVSHADLVKFVLYTTISVVCLGTHISPAVTIFDGSCKHAVHRESF